MILRCQVHDRSELRGPRPFSDFNSVLASLLRLNAASSGYAASILRVAEEMANLQSSPWVSQRIYVGWGTTSLRDLGEHQALMLMATVPMERCAPSNELVRQLEMTARRDDEAARTIEAHLQHIQTALGVLNSEVDGPLVRELRSGEADFAVLVDNTRQLLQQCLQTLSAQRDELIRAAPIDAGRLDTIAAAATAYAFDKVTSGFPICLFEEVERSAEVLQPYTLIRTQFPRGEITTPLMSTPVANEREWWRETMRDYAGAIVTNDIVFSPSVREVSARTAESWWAEVKAAAAATEATASQAILLVSNEFEPPWLYGWIWHRIDVGQPECPKDLAISKLEGDPPPAYICNFNSIAVYRAPIDRTCSYVVPVKALKRVEFTDYGQNRCVLIEFDQDRSDPWHGSLKATFARRVILDGGGIVRLRFADPPTATPKGSAENIGHADPIKPVDDRSDGR